MSSIKILWVDDEIDLLRPHLMFLEQRDYQIVPCNNGQDALTHIKSTMFDAVILDENMPGLNGLETLNEIKSIFPNLPVIMITKFNLGFPKIADDIFREETKFISNG